MFGHESQYLAKILLWFLLYHKKMNLQFAPNFPVCYCGKLLMWWPQADIRISSKYRDSNYHEVL